MPDGTITLRDIFNLVETQGKRLGEVVVSLAVLTQKVEDLPPHPIQPCGGLIEHLEGHKAVRVLWQRQLIGTVVRTGTMIIAGILCFLLGRGG